MSQLDDDFISLARRCFSNFGVRLANLMTLRDDNPIHPDEVLAAMKDTDEISKPLTLDDLEKRFELIIQFSSEQLHVCPEGSDGYDTLCMMRKESIESLLLLRKKRRKELYSRYKDALRIDASESLPRLAQFALLLIPKRNREHLIGDLEEEYRTIVLPQYGPFLASCFYCWQVVASLAAYVWPCIKRIVGLTALWKIMRG
jgi:hypothetical protein